MKKMYKKSSITLISLLAHVFMQTFCGTVHTICLKSATKVIKARGLHQDWVPTGPNQIMWERVVFVIHILNDDNKGRSVLFYFVFVVGGTKLSKKYMRVPQINYHEGRGRQQVKWK